MILDEEHVALALEVMGDGERAYQVTFNEVMAEAALDEMHSALYQRFTGTIAEREAQVICHPDYQAKMKEYAHSKGELARFKSEKEKSEAVTRVWQTEQSNVRASERIR